MLRSNQRLRVEGTNQQPETHIQHLLCEWVIICWLQTAETARVGCFEWLSYSPAVPSPWPHYERKITHTYTHISWPSAPTSHESWLNDDLLHMICVATCWYQTYWRCSLKSFASFTNVLANLATFQNPSAVYDWQVSSCSFVIVVVYTCTNVVSVITKHFGPHFRSI